MKPKKQASAAPKAKAKKSQWKELPVDTPVEKIVDAVLGKGAKAKKKRNGKAVLKPRRGGRVVEQLQSKRAVLKTLAPAREWNKPLNGRQEKFCREYVAGKTATEAYGLAYGNMSSAEAASSRLLTSVKVQERLRQLRTEAAAGSVLSLREKRAFLRRVVVTPIGQVDEHSDLCQEYVSKHEGGARGRLKRGKADRGNEEHEDEYEVIKIKMPDKLRAIELDAKLAGELKDELRVEAGDGLSELLASIRGGE